MRCASLVGSIILGSLIGPLPSNSSALAGQVTTNFTSLLIAAADLLFWSEELEPYREGPRGCPDSVDSAQVGFAKAVDWYWTDSIDATARTYFDRYGDPVMVNLNLNSLSYRDSTGHWVVPNREDFSVHFVVSHEAIHISGVEDHADSLFIDLAGCFGVVN